MQNSHQQRFDSKQWPERIEKLLFIIVMKQEAAYIIKDFGFTLLDDSNKIYTLYQCSYQNGKQLYLIQGKTCPLYDVCPVGSDQAAMLTQLGIDRVKPDIAISVGTCGGLTYPQYTVCIPSECRFIDREMILDSYKPFITSNYPVLDPTKVTDILGFKKAVCGSTNSFTDDASLAKSKQVDIVEMEAATESRTCYLNEIPFTAIKIVSDAEVKDEDLRSQVFMKFLEEGPKVLANAVKQFVENVDSFKN